MPIIAWLLEKLTSKIALPMLAVLLVTNIASGVGLAITRHTLADRTLELSAEKLAHAADLATFKAATAQAEVNDKAHAITVQQQQDRITQEKQNAFQDQLASARAIAARWMRAHPAPAADHSGIQTAAVSPAPNTTGQPDGTPASAVISAADVDACTVAYTVAKGWQDWWAKEQPIWQAGAAPDVSMIVPVPTVQRKDPLARATVLALQTVRADRDGVSPLLVTDVVRQNPDKAGRPGDQEQQADDHNHPPDHKNFLP